MPGNVSVFSPFVDVKIFWNEQFQVENVINHSFK